MNFKPNLPENYTYSFSDFTKLFKREKSRIFLSAIFFGLIASFYSLSRPIQYTAEGTFKEKAKVASGISSISAVIFGTNLEDDNEAISMMRSRKLMQGVAYQLGLQANLAPKGYRFNLLNTFELIVKNIKIQYAYTTKKIIPTLKDFISPIRPINVFYSLETPTTVTLKFDSDTTYHVFDHHHELLGQGMIEKPFVQQTYQFTIQRNHQEPMTAKEWNLTLIPLMPVLEGINANLDIEFDRIDKNLLNIQFRDPNRFKAAEIVNTIMDNYYEYLRHEQTRIANEQISYLERRQSDAISVLKEMMHEHAKNISLDISTTGNANTTRAMEFLANNQNHYKQKLLEIDLEMKRLHNAQKEGPAYYDSLTAHGDPLIINSLLSEIRNLKQFGDSIDLALRKSSNIDEKSRQDNFNKLVKEFEDIKQYSEDARYLLANHESDELLSRNLSLMEEPKFLVRTWIERLHQLQIAQKNKKDREKEREYYSYKENFLIYIANLLHLLNVHGKIIQERLAHQESFQQEFQGIELDTARQLYLDYSRKLNDYEAQNLQNQFIINQLLSPEFEISSLSPIQNDFITNQMINKASELVLSLKDQNNRSQKEQDRLKEELSLQKKFLDIHLKQSIQVVNLMENLVKDKIRILQSVTLGLVHQKISILEKQLFDYIQSRIKDLKQERLVVEEHLQTLRNEMASLSRKWVDEKLIEQKMELNRKMVEEVTKLVESKNIANNLEIVQSSQVDTALPPAKPDSPRLFYFAFLGSLLGACLSCATLFVRSIIYGMQATQKNLQLVGCHVSGSISKIAKDGLYLRDRDLETLRRLIAYFCFNLNPITQKRGQALLLICGHGVDFSHVLAELMAKQGFRVLLLPISFDRSEEGKDTQSNLLKYLLEGSNKPKPISQGHYDQIYEGGIHRFAHELLNSKRFTELIDEFTKDYDWVVAVSHISPKTGEAEALSQLFDNIIINVTYEPLNDMNCFQKKKDSSSCKKISFVINEDS